MCIEYYEQELQLCWDALHRLVYGAKGLCDENTWRNEKQALSSGQRVPLDYFKHARRCRGVPWDQGSEAWAADERGGGPSMLDWLGIYLHVSSWGRNPQALSLARKTFLRKARSGSALMLRPRLLSPRRWSRTAVRC